jgi:hypothetical protein
MNHEKQGNEWDIFICHASEDKDEIVRPLAMALVEQGLRVWYDEFTLTVGDHLRRSIDKGLALSRYGLVVLSPNFFAKNWPQTELDGLTVRERGGEKIILPVWHNVDEPYVRRFSPTLADRVAVSTQRGLESVVKEILNAMRLPEPIRKPEETTEKPVRGRLRAQAQPKTKYEYEELVAIGNMYVADWRPFDTVFDNLQKATQPQTKELWLAELEKKLLDLNSVSWDDEVAKRIADVVKYVPLMLSDDPHVDHYVYCLKIIIDIYGRHTIPMIKEKFLSDVEKMYSDPKFEMDTRILHILLELDEYNAKNVMEVIDDATDRWSNARFQDLSAHINFAELRRRNEEDFCDVLEYLTMKMDEAARNKDEQRVKRLRKLLESALNADSRTGKVCEISRLGTEKEGIKDVHGLLSSLGSNKMDDTCKPDE